VRMGINGFHFSSSNHAETAIPNLMWSRTRLKRIMTDLSSKHY